MNDKFQMYKKWFWIGIIIAFLNFLAGLIYGVALYVEPEHRKEGGLIIGWSVLIFAFYILVIFPWLGKAGILP